MNYEESKQYLHPVLLKKLEQLQTACAMTGLPIKYSEGYRTVEEQNELYAQGRTKPGKIVTNASGTSYSSQHQWGIACDFYRADGKGAYNEEGGFFDRVGKLALSCGLGWGGTWTSIIDKPHLYLADYGSTTSGLKTKYGTPQAFMKTFLQKGDDEGSVQHPKQESGVKPNTNITKGGKKLDNKQWQILFVTAVQMLIGAEVDGIAGENTFAKLPTLSRSKNRMHKTVFFVQQWLNRHGFDCGKEDGIAGAKFDAAVKKLQLNELQQRCPDGEMTSGKATWKYMLTYK